MVGGSQSLTISYEARCVAFCGGLWFFGAPTVMIRIHYSIPCCIRRPLQSGFSHSRFFFVWVVMASSSKDGVTVKANSDVNGADHARMGQRVAAIIAQYKDTPRNQSHNHSSQS